ncbi:MAG TPA: NADH-quinone oxidoreductase subunit NuoN, partial [Terricaulis sp.]|nr:NADH-quinone oxidoreductase subunit NuoN [Terricaulis sp.]
MIGPVQDLMHSLPYVRPELLLAGFALIAAVLGAWGGEKGFGLISTLGVLALVAAGGIAILDRPADAVAVFQGSLVIDGVGVFAKALIAFAAAATLALATDYFGATREKRFEFPVLVVLAALGMFIMVSAQDLISLYVGVELQSLCAYVLAAWRRDDAHSSEAGLKYFVLSAIASGLLLYGASFVYGFTGSIRFDAIAAAVSDGAGGVGLLFGLVLMLCALGFKMSAVPFHMWTPDVYEGAPTPVTAFFAAAPKIAAVALMARVLYEPFAAIENQWVQVVAALSAISMVWGAFGALMQTNLKRLMAYSSITNMGFALMGLASGVEEGPAAALMYLALYVPATIGTFALIMAMRRAGAPAETVADLAGLARKKPWMAALFTMLMFSLAGIPPFAGFIGKLLVF